MKSLACSLLVTLLTLAGFAQGQAPAAPAAGSRLVHLNVVVAPRKGDPVANLPQSAFTVLDNGVPQPIRSFRAVTPETEPVQVLLVVDAVNIPYIQLAYERDQMKSFLRSNDGKLLQPTSLAVVTDTSVEITGASRDGNALSQTLENKVIGLRELRRSSGFFGAEERLQISVKALESLVARTKNMPGRKVIIWASPGWPMLSGPAVQLSNRQQQGLFQDVVRISTLIQDSDVTLYSVDPLGAQQNPGWTFYYEQFLRPLRRQSDVLPGDLGLQVLAVHSGGLALSSSNDVRALLQQCMDDTKAFYEITYVKPPADAPDQFHQVQVKVNVPGVNARTLQGYFSRP